MFIQPNHTKATLQAGKPVYGVISTSDDPQLAELCALGGFDYYMLDAEHGPLNPAQAANVARACERSGITPLVRVGPKDPKLVLQYLDAGMMGIMMPGLESEAEIKMLVDAVKYAPLGKRGAGFARAARYQIGGTQAAEYFKFANEHTMVIPQFEDPALIEEFEAMISVPGVDAVIIGPRDLSLAMGFADGPEHSEVQAMIERVIGICLRKGIAAGITAGNRDDAAKQVARGARMILAGMQSMILAGAREFLPANS